MPKDKVKGEEGRLAKAAIRTPVKAIGTALSAGFGVPGILPGLIPPQWRLSAREQQPRSPGGPPKKGKGR